MEELSEINRRLKDDPNDTDALRSLGRRYLKEGSFKQSQSYFLQAMNGNPHLLPYILLDHEKRIENDWHRIGNRLSLAGLLLSSGLIEDAMVELEEIIDLNPVSVEAYNSLGRIYILQEKTDEAIFLLERSIKEGVKDVSLTEILAAAYLGKGMINEAIKFYGELLSSKPGDKQTLRTLGELNFRVEDYQKAASCYKEMFSEDPEVASEIIQRLEELLKKVEGSIEIRELLAEIYTKMMNPEAAVDKLRSILRLESTKVEEIISKLKDTLKNYPDLPEAIFALAEAQVKQGNFSEAAENYYKLLKVKPHLIENVIEGYRAILELCPGQVLARAYLGEALLDQNKLEEALDEFGKMVEQDPSVADLVIKKCREFLRFHSEIIRAKIVLGKAYIAKGEFQKAAAEAEGALAIDKNMPSAYLLLGEAYSKLNILRKSIEVLKNGMAVDPYNFELQQKFQEIREKEINSEIDLLRKRIKEDQWKISLHYELARHLIQKNEHDEAIRSLQYVIKDSSLAPQAYNLLGNIYRLNGRFDSAAEQYEKALEITTAEFAKVVRLNLGSTYEARGQLRQAIKIYEEIVLEDIDFGGLGKRLKQLKSTNLKNMRSFPLQIVMADPAKKDILALWGKEPKNAGRVRDDDLSVSFGDEHNRAGFDYFMRGMYPAAEEELQLAVGLDSRYSVALNNLAVVLMKEGKFEEAKQKLSEALRADPVSAVINNNLGVLWTILEDDANAKILLEKSAALDPNSSPICINLADLYYKSREVRKALDLYKRVGDFDPLSDIAKQRLQYKIA